MGLKVEFSQRDFIRTQDFGFIERFWLSVATHTLSVIPLLILIMVAFRNRHFLIYFLIYFLI